MIFGRSNVLIVAVVALIGLLVGCESEDFGQKERKDVDRVLRTGVELESDPFVRAETLRVLEILADPDLNEFARPRVDDSSPMVRVAALRLLMKTDASDVRRMALARFNKAEDAEKRAILEAAYEYGSPPMQRELTGRALRAEDSQLRRMAFDNGPAQRVRDAVEKDKNSYLQNTLFPEVGRYITRRDDLLAAEALALMVSAGEEDRAEPLIETVRDASVDAEDRREAARILSKAGVEQAAPVFEELLEDLRIDDEGGFVLPRRRDEQLVRIATLGLVATGNETYVPQAQAYLKGADVGQSLDVLEALAQNPSEEARISLKIAMQDARTAVRHRAIELYGDREDARAADLIASMRGADYESEKRAAVELARQFPDQWAEHLSKQLDKDDKRKATLTLLRDVITTEAEAAVLVPLKDQLLELAKSENEDIASLAGISLVRVSDDPEIATLLRQNNDVATRYAYLEHLLQKNPAENAKFFRQNFYSDRYSLRLMSGAGLLAAYEQGGVDDLR
ncbi:MAG: hypothetical protein ACQEVA_00215 [Myxococcota bacterium]